MYDEEKSLETKLATPDDAEIGYIVDVNVKYPVKKTEYENVFFVSSRM